MARTWEVTITSNLGTRALGCQQPGKPRAWEDGTLDLWKLGELGYRRTWKPESRQPGHLGFRLHGNQVSRDTSRAGSWEIWRRGRWETGEKLYE